MSAAPSPQGLRARFDQAPMSRVQIGAVAITVALSALDGYDVLSATFAAPAISAGWGVGKGALGLFLASGLAGMALGAFCLAPLADLFGRRKLILLAIVLMGLGSLLTAFAGSVPQLAVWRVLTGLGIGACVAVINPVAAEFANARRRPLALSLMAMGYPVGGVIGAVLSAVLLKVATWPVIFMVGAGAAAVLLPLVAWLLPESPAFLAASRAPDALNKLNRLLTRCQQPALAELPVTPVGARRGYALILTGAQRGVTLRLALAGFLYSGVAYYTLSWLPQMVADAGFDPSKASLVALAANLVGIAGGVIFGALGARLGVQRLTVVMMTGLGVAIAAFGFAPPVFGLLIAVAAVCGFFLFAGTAGLYATLAIGFSDEGRASGSGFVSGVGRISSAIAPALAGTLFAGGWGRAEVSAAFAVCAILAAVVLARRVRTLVP
jgi:AAHS family 4-hydroxybenzoate transporter-like MFS transporter